MLWIMLPFLVLAIPLLFPEATLVWLRQLQTWVQDRQREREHQRADLKHLLHLHKQWHQEVNNLHYHTSSPDSTTAINKAMTHALEKGKSQLLC